MAFKRICARCERSFSPLTRSSVWCQEDGVFLCADCSGEAPCLYKQHRLKNPGLLIFLVMGVIALGLTYFPVLAAERLEIQRGWADLPTTPIADLAPGASEKVSGTIVASTQPVLWEVKDGDDVLWRAVPFWIEDGSGAVGVDVSLLNGSSGLWTIEPGVHGRTWWPGDAASLVGTVDQFPNGTARLVARAIARGPTGFFRVDLTIFMLFALPAFPAAVSAYTGVTYRRRSASHRDRSASYPHKLALLRTCQRCGGLFDPAEGVCPACGWRPAEAPLSPLEASTKARRLPTLDFRTGLRYSSESTRRVVLGVLVGGGLLVTALSAWFGSFYGPWGVVGFATFGLALVAVFAVAIVAGQNIHLSPEEIRIRQWRFVQSMRTADIGMILQIDGRGEPSYTLVPKTGELLMLGAALPANDAIALEAWLHDLADSIGVRYQAHISFNEAMTILEKRGGLPRDLAP